ncbi:MAG: SpoIIE family protein phosphatase [Waddliaceae bacterium]
MSNSLTHPLLSLGLSKPLETFASKVLLIDDQEIVGKAIEGMLDKTKDISFFFCSDPSKGLDMANRLFPTVILLDLFMPTIDGLTLLRKFRANQTTKDVPIIVLSSEEDPVTKAASFAQGANDYLIKLPDKVELIARIRHHSAAHIRLLERNQAYERLQESQEQLKHELDEGASFVRSMLPPPMVSPFRISWQFIPSQQLGGDAFGYHWVDRDHLAIYLLDVCGHGIGAALLSVSVLTMLRFQQLADVNFLSPREVIRGLSQVFLMREQNYTFFTLWYGVVSKSKRKLVFCNGGHPPAILITGDSQATREVFLLSSQGPVIGMDPNAVYSNQEYAIKRDNKLFVFSDGTYEIEKKDNEFMDIDEYVSIVRKVAEEDDPIEKLLLYAENLEKNESFRDDYSMIQFILP